MKNIKFDFSKMDAAIEQKAKEAIRNKHYEVPCKNCHAKVIVPVGKSICPHCGKEINLILNIH